LSNCGEGTSGVYAGESAGGVVKIVVFVVSSSRLVLLSLTLRTSLRCRCQEECRGVVVVNVVIADVGIVLGLGIHIGAIGAHAGIGVVRVVVVVVVGAVKGGCRLGG